MSRPCRRTHVGGLLAALLLAGACQGEGAGDNAEGLEGAAAPTAAVEPAAAGTEALESNFEALTAEEQSGTNAAQSSAATIMTNSKPQYRVKPILECVEKVSPTKYIAHWGWDNKTTATVKIPVGPTNRFYLAPKDRGQGTSFAKGRNVKKFKTPFTEPFLAWVVDGNFAIALRSSTRCPSPPKECPATCNDNNACTADVCGKHTNYKCVYKPLSNGTSCSDKNACNGIEVCQSGQCKPGKPLVCRDDKNPCTAERCDANLGCVATNVADGTKCSITANCGAAGQQCKAGKCVATTKKCDDGKPCTNDICNSNGSCKYTNVAAGTSCGDMDVCNGEEVCNSSGTCGTGTPVTCQDDGNPCTVESCDVDNGCASTPGNEGGACSLPGGAAGQCAEGACVNQCDDGNPCTTDTFQGGACVFTNNTNACDDGVKCTTGDVCSAGVCKGTAKVCGGGATACREASVCDESTGLCSGGAAKPDGTTCDDGNACTTADSCQAGACTGTAKVCAASDQCHTAGVCDPASGVCSNPVKADGAACNDGLNCTVSDVCTNGSCGGAPKACAPFSACHVAGVCVESTGACTNPAAPVNTPCNDGNACTTTDTCDGSGLCRAGAPVQCSGGDACNNGGTCNPGTGVCEGGTPKPNGTSCDDSNACTTSDSCQAGACRGTAKVCQAQDACHLAGVCNPADGVCSNPNAPSGTSCNDGLRCTDSDVCNGSGVCGGTQKTCTASDACHVAGVCEESTGVCTNPAAPNGTTCSDGNTCTQTDSCQGGACTGSNPVVCTSPDQCKDPGSCEPSSGLCLAAVNKPNGTTCSDGSLCTDSDVCTEGACGGTQKTCTASDACHVAGSCDPSTGVCSNPAAPNGTSCSDNNLCTEVDVCTDGTCSGTARTCTASDQCHEAGSCDPSTGVCSNPASPSGKACADGLQCTDNDVCNGAGACGGTAVVCSGGACREDVPPADRCPPVTAVCEAGRWADMVPISLDGSPVVASVTGVANDSSGVVYVGGSLFNTVSFPGGETKTSNGGSDIYVAQVNPATGAFAWVRNYGNDKDQNVTNVAANNAGVVGVIGGYTGDVDFTGATLPTAPANNFPYIAGVKSSDGDGVFAAPVNLGTGGILQGIAASPVDGGFVICGTRVVSSTNRDLYVAKFSATGSLVWDGSAPFAATGNQACQSVAFNDAGDVFLTGNNASQVLVAKLNGVTGVRIWSSGFPQASGTPSSVAITVDAAGNAFITGSYTRPLTFGATVLTPVGGEEAFVAKVDGVAGTALWAKSFGDPVNPDAQTVDTQQGKGISVNSKGEVFASGLVKGSMVVDASTTLTAAGTTGGSDAYVLKLKGEDGSKLCANVYGDDLNQVGGRIITGRNVTTAEKDATTLIGTFSGKMNFGGTSSEIDAALDQRSFVVNLK